MFQICRAEERGREKAVLSVIIQRRVDLSCESKTFLGVNMLMIKVIDFHLSSSSEFDASIMTAFSLCSANFLKLPEWKICKAFKTVLTNFRSTNHLTSYFRWLLL